MRKFRGEANKNHGPQIGMFGHLELALLKHIIRFDKFYGNDQIIAELKAIVTTLEQNNLNRSDKPNLFLQ